jgi:mono/diheme cytochrome c family protein
MSAGNAPEKSSPRRESEPAAGLAPSPIWLIALLTVLLYAGLVYLNSQAGGFQAEVYQPYASVEDVSAAWPPPAGGEAALRGQKLFTLYCAVCHQATGMGTPGQFPPLAGSDWVAAKSPNRILRGGLNGLTGPITVSGKQFNNTMVSWKSMGLTDQQVSDVLTFVRGNKEWGNSAPPVTPEQVKAVRDKIADRSEPFTPDELVKIPEDQ